ncbi:MAG: hypothetical protein IJF05_03640 [Clostridia bacterium]|nr:hypothetical protein [Clostridia bacterium]
MFFALYLHKTTEQYNYITEAVARQGKGVNKMKHKSTFFRHQIGKNAIFKKNEKNLKNGIDFFRLIGYNIKARKTRVTSGVRLAP